MEYVALWDLSFVRLVDYLAGAILDGSPVAPAATSVQQVIDAVRQAARGGWVRV
jgi:hypothetical protein